ncbi:MAG: T9SS type A sorting domain-containing protein [Candidatus Cloacimonetes bacterium]|nr:T9SS type A sorting domain-containing protein [Candidatus Cloacimonadota bacterium]
MKQKLILLLILISFVGLFADGTEPIGSGTQTDPYQIEILDNLLWISTNSDSWDKHYIQTVSIDATDTQNWNGGEGFSPIGIGTSYYNCFTGTYNGQDYTIDSLFMNRSTSDYQGLFGSTSGATIENLGIINVNVNGYYSVGGLVGSFMNFSTINNCYSTGSVNGFECVGGLMGFGGDSTISICYSTASVNGTGSAIGGLVGYYAFSLISDCYSTASVDGTGSGIGGLVGVVGNGSTTSNSFWDIETSGTVIGVGYGTSTGVTGKTTVEMQNVATYTDLSTIGLDIPWDFVGNPFDDIGNEDYWDIDIEINNGYPFLTSIPLVDIDDEVITDIPEVSELLGNYPNPFNPSTTISFSIPEESKVKVIVYNIKGQKVKQLVSDQLSAGKHTVIWNGRDSNDKRVGSGIYFYKLEAGRFEKVKKMILIK